jgi:hypothetical protein
MIEFIFAFAIIVQAVWLVAQAHAHRQEVRSLQRRVNSLGTELGIVKARALRPEKRPLIDDLATPVNMADGLALGAAIAAADFRLPDYYRSQRSAFETFSPSWI